MRFFVFQKIYFLQRCRANFGTKPFLRIFALQIQNLRKKNGAPIVFFSALRRAKFANFFFVGRGNFNFKNVPFFFVAFYFFKTNAAVAPGTRKKFVVRKNNFAVRIFCERKNSPFFFASVPPNWKINNIFYFFVKCDFHFFQFYKKFFFGKNFFSDKFFTKKQSHEVVGKNFGQIFNFSKPFFW